MKFIRNFDKALKERKLVTEAAENLNRKFNTSVYYCRLDIPKGRYVLAERK